MTNITFKTTWSEAQQMLIDNPTFAEDTDLLSKCAQTTSMRGSLFNMTKLGRFIYGFYRQPLIIVSSD